jgi:hypothetical protein
MVQIRPELLARIPRFLQQVAECGAVVLIRLLGVANGTQSVFSRQSSKGLVRAFAFPIVLVFEVVSRHLDKQPLPLGQERPVESTFKMIGK